MGIEARLQSERARLGLTQDQVAEAVGSTKRSVINWEGGASQPSAAVLARYAEIGADVLYILTGRRESTVGLPVAEAVPSYDTHPPVSRGDRVLLDNFHAAPPQVQAGIKTTLGAFAPDKPSRRKGRKDAA